MSDCLHPSIQVLIALGSIAIHAEESLSNKGHFLDIVALKSALQAPELQEWFAQMNKMALLPLKR